MCRKWDALCISVSLHSVLITGEKLQLLRLSGSSTYVLVSVLVLSLCVEAFANTEDFQTVNAHVRIHDIPVFIYLLQISSQNSGSED